MTQHTEFPLALGLHFLESMYSADSNPSFAHNLPPKVLDNMRSLYARYLEERTDQKILETAESFCTYRYVNEKTVYLIDMFTVPERRLYGHASHLADIVIEKAKKHGCTEMMTSIVPGTKNASLNLKLLLDRDWILDRIEGGFIILRKDL